MPQRPPLPEDLKTRLLAAGAKDDASLRAALKADPELRASYQDWLFSYAIHAFAAAADREALAALSDQIPQITSDDFIAVAQNAVDAALHKNDYENAEALQQRLDALKEIKSMKAYQRQPPLAQAVIAFVQAEDDEAARNAYQTHRQMLDSEAAAKMLSTYFEANDVKARSHLRRRAALLKQLRAK